jgi:hypothetical protein
MAIGASFISGIFVFVLVAYCCAFAVYVADWALILTHFLNTSSLDHLRYLVDTHSMLEYSEGFEDVASVR